MFGASELSLEPALTPCVERPLPCSGQRHVPWWAAWPATCATKLRALQCSILLPSQLEGPASPRKKAISTLAQSRARGQLARG